MAHPQLPDDVRLVRTTRTFDERTVPGGLLATHRIADGVWGRLVVTSGSLRFVVETPAAEPTALGAGESIVIAPGVAHHVAIDGEVEFHIEFHR